MPSREETRRAALASLRNVNIVLRAKLATLDGRKIKLINVKKIAARNAWFVHSPLTFGAGVSRLRYPSSSLSLYPASASITCMGDKSISSIVLSLHKFVHILNMNDIKCKIIFISISNVVSNAILPFAVDLNTLAKKHPNAVNYKNDFPGALITCALLGIVTNMKMTVFANGKMIITGSKSREETVDVFSRVLDGMLINFMIDDNSVVAKDYNDEDINNGFNKHHQRKKRQCIGNRQASFLIKPIVIKREDEINKREDVQIEAEGDGDHDDYEDDDNENINNRFKSTNSILNTIMANHYNKKNKPVLDALARLTASMNY